MAKVISYQSREPSCCAEFKTEVCGRRSYDTVFFSCRGYWAAYDAEFAALIRLPALLSQSDSAVAVVWEVDKANAGEQLELAGAQLITERDSDELCVKWAADRTSTVCMALRHLIESEHAYRMMILSPPPVAPQAIRQTNGCEYAWASETSTCLRFYDANCAMLVSQQPRQQILASCRYAWQSVGYPLPVESLDNGGNRV